MPTNYTRLLQFSQQFKRFYSRQFASVLEQTGLTMREIHVLLFLMNNPSCDTAREIVNLRGMSKSQVSQAVDLLAAEGLLHRTPDQTDRRMVHLSITPLGEPLARTCQEIQRQCGQRLLEGMTAEESARFQASLELVLENGVQLAKEMSI